MKSFNDFFQDREPRADPKTRNEGVIKSNFSIKKAVDEKMQAFGWASIAVEEDGHQIDDWQDDMIDPEDLENAAYNFVEFYRDAGEMHERNGIGTLIESMVFTPDKLKALGIPEGTLPTGWWVGFQITDPDVWAKIKSGEYTMFSIEGTAERVDADADDGSDEDQPGNEPS